MLEDKLAQEVVALDVASLTPVAEYFVITHGKMKWRTKTNQDLAVPSCHGRQ